MCVLKGTVTHRSHDYPAHVLLDSGADGQYISAAFVRKAQLSIDTCRNEAKWVKVANGTYSQVPGEVSFTLLMGEYRSRIVARVLDLPDFDIILGYHWLREVNPVIDWKTLRVEVRGRGGETYELPPALTTGYVDSHPLAFEIESEPLLTGSQTRRYLRQSGTESFLMVVQRASDASSAETKGNDKKQQMPPALERLCKQFHDVFKEELPERLPPPRDQEHTIDTGDARPVNLNSYPLSPVHLAEQSQQIAKLLEQGLIEESSSPWGFPVLFVKKPGGKWRMCINY